MMLLAVAERADFTKTPLKPDPQLPRQCNANAMTQFAPKICALPILSGFFGPAFSPMRTLPAGPKVSSTAVTPPVANFPQYTRVDTPSLRFGSLKRQRSPQGKLASSTEFQRARGHPRGATHQINISAAYFNTVAGDVPFLEGINLSGMLPRDRKPKLPVTFACYTLTPHLSTTTLR